MQAYILVKDKIAVFLMKQSKKFLRDLN